MHTSFARVIMLSATLRSSLAFVSVVSIRSCCSSCDTIVLQFPGQAHRRLRHANVGCHKRFKQQLKALRQAALLT